MHKIGHKNLPKISAIINVLNAGKTLEKCFEFFFAQNYPLSKLEIVIPEGGSTDNSLEIIKKYQKRYIGRIKVVSNPKKYKLGRGMGADIASRKASGDMILMMDADNFLIQKNWLKDMVSILLKNKDINAVQSGTIVPKFGSAIDKYFGAIGIEDPFAIVYSLNAQVIFNPRRFQYNSKEKFYIYEVNKRDFYYFGDNGFLIWKRDFFENDGYTQDIDNSYRMALSDKKYKIAIPKNLKLHHKSSTTISNFLKKKGFYVRIYLKNNMENRYFNWFSLKKNSLRQNFRFINNVMYNLLILPGLMDGIKFALKEKKAFWLIHPMMINLITLEYIRSFFQTKFSKKEISLDSRP